MYVITGATGNIGSKVADQLLAKGEKVLVSNFGSFRVISARARRGRNPATGETIQIAASNVPGFKAGKALKDAVN